jgi:hypothetical protein
LEPLDDIGKSFLATMNEVLEQDNPSIVNFFRWESNFALFVFSGE